MNLNNLDLGQFSKNFNNLIECANYTNKYEGCMSYVELYLNFERENNLKNFNFSKTCDELIYILKKYTNSQSREYYIKNEKDFYKLSFRDFYLIKDFDSEQLNSIDVKEILIYIKKLKQQQHIKNIQKNIIYALNEGIELSSIKDIVNKSINSIENSNKKIKAKVKK